MAALSRRLSSSSMAKTCKKLMLFPCSSAYLRRHHTGSVPFFKSVSEFREFLDDGETRQVFTNSLTTPEGWRSVIEPLVADNRIHGRPLHHTYSAMIRACCETHMIRESFWILNKMTEKGVIQTIFTYNTIFHGLSWAGMLEKSILLRAPMLKRNIAFNYISYNILIEGYLANKNTMKAEEVLHQMFLTLPVVRPDNHLARIYAGLMYGHASEGRPYAARAYYNRLKGLGFPLDLATYRIIITACRKLGMWKEASEFVYQLNQREQLEAQGTIRELLDEFFGASSTKSENY